MNTSKKMAVVTGANHGIGFETAVGMAEAGFNVVLACRNEQKAQEAKKAIQERVPGASLEILLIDLSSFDSVREFAQAYRARHDRIDVLINNAGILLYSAQTNNANIEAQFATNHLGHFLLTALLIGLIPDVPESRIVALSSIAHKGTSIHFDDLTCGGNGGEAYGQSKLACLMFADELNRRLNTSGRHIKALAVHPGGSDSGLFGEMNRLQYYFLKLLAPLITHSNASAAKPSLYAALSSEVEGGDYYGPTGFKEMRGKVGRSKRDPYSNDKDAATRLWLLSEKLTDVRFS